MAKSNVYRYGKNVKDIFSIRRQVTVLSFKKEGDNMESVKDIILNGIKFEYTIDTSGRIQNKNTGKYLKPFLNPQGYCLVDLSNEGKSHTVQFHRLVALAFIPNPDNLDTVNHIDGNKQNNHVKNLEWLSLRDNVRHAWNTGLAKPRYGLDNPANVYTEEQIHKVCQLLEQDELGNKKIAELCGVDVTLIRDIKFRGRWEHISRNYKIPTEKKTGTFRNLDPFIIYFIRMGYQNREIFDIIINGKTRYNSKSLKRHIECIRYRYSHSLIDYPWREYTISK